MAPTGSSPCGSAGQHRLQHPSEARRLRDAVLALGSEGRVRRGLGAVERLATGGTTTAAPSAPCSVTSTSTSTVTPPTSSTSAESADSSNTHDPATSARMAVANARADSSPPASGRASASGKLTETVDVDEDARGDGEGAALGQTSIPADEDGRLRGLLGSGERDQDARTGGNVGRRCYPSGCRHLR